MHKAGYESKFREVVKKGKWDDVMVVGSDYEETDEDPDIYLLIA